MEKEISLYSVPELEPSYTRVVDFQNRINQVNWFSNKLVRVISANVAIEPNLTTVTLDEAYENLMSVDYVSMKDSSGKEIYYFVIDRDIRTSRATTLILMIDVFQTYQFDIIIRDSFIDRCHVPRWNNGLPTNEITDEGLPTGEMIITNIENMYTLPDQYLIVCSSPLGPIGKDSSGGGGTPSSVVDSARKLLGKPYVWGGNYPPLGTDEGTDCSGLCMWAYRDAGYADIGPSGRWTTYNMVNYGTEITDLRQTMPGDLIFSGYADGKYEHVAMITNTSTQGKVPIIEALQPGTVISEREITYNSSMQIRRYL